jgi:hypothetical protein
MTILGGGNVGIGTTSPAAKLHIDVTTEDNQPALRISKVSDQNENALEVHHGTSSSARGIADFTNSVGSVLYVRGDGNVGIGTTSPDEKLRVDSGNIQLTNGNYIIFDGPAPKTTKMRSYYDGSQAHIAMTVANTTVLDLRADGLSTFSGDVTIASSDLKLSSAHYVQFGDATARIQGSNASNYLKLYTGAVARLTITNTEATFSGDLVVSGGLTINGTTTTIDTANLLVEDKNIIIGNVSSPSDTTADGGGITLKGASDYTINWTNSTNSWHFNQGITVGANGTGHDVVFYGDTSDRYMTWDQSADKLHLRDSVQLTLGTHNDLQLSHDGVHGHVLYGGPNNFQISGYSVILIGYNDGSTYGETAIQCIKNGAVKLRHDNSQKFTTDAGGITVTGKMTSDTITTGLSLEMFASGGNNYISSEASGSHLIIRNTGGGNTIIHGTTNENAIIAKPNGAVELYWNNLLRLSTTDIGVHIDDYLSTDHINMSGELNFIGNGSKYIDVFTLANSNSFNIRHHNPTGNAFETAFQSVANGATTLYFDGAARFATTTDGIQLHGSGYVDLPDNGRLRLGTNHDMMFYHYSSLSILDFQNHDGLIRNLTNDKLFIFQTTSGGTQYEILRLGGNTVDARFSQHVNIGSSGTPKDLTTFGSTSARYMKWDGSADLLNFMDNVKITIGNSNDLQLYHDGSNSYIANDTTGDLYIQQNLADKDIVFQCDDGSGGTTDYLRLDGSDSIMKAHKKLRFLDNVKATFGNSDDFQIYHTGTNTTLYDQGTGALVVATNQFKVLSANQAEQMITATENGAVNLFHNNTTRLQTTSTGVRILGDKFGIYQGIEEDNYYFDDYNGARNVTAILNTQRADIIRYQSFQNLESWNGSAWVDASSQNNNLKNLLDGRTDTSWYVPSTYYKFRFEISASTDWPLRALIGLQTSWSGSSFPECEMIVEEKQTDGTWATKVTAQFTSANGITNWGTMLRADSALHTGRGMTFETRITIDFYGWTPSNASYTTIPLQNIIISSNYSGNITHDTQNLLNYDRDILAPADLTVTGKSLFNGAEDNGGKADFAVATNSGNPQISWRSDQVQIGHTDMNWNGKVYHDGTFHVASWSSHMRFFTQSNTSNAYDIYWQTWDGSSLTEKMRLKGDGKLGIGTTTPSRTLHVYDSAGPTIKFERSGSSNLEFQFGTTNTSIIGAGEIQFRANGGSTNKFIINNSQIQSNAKLLVNTNSGIDVHTNDTGTIIQSGNSSATSTPDQFFINHSAANVDMGNNRGNIKITKGFLIPMFSDQGGGLSLEAMRWSYYPASGSYYLSLATEVPASGVVRYHWNMKNNGTAYDDVMVFDRGNVGIGTSSPQRALEISAAGTSGGGIMRLTSTGETSAGDAVGKIEFFNSDTTDYTQGVMASIKAVAGPSGGEGHLQFLTDMPSEGAEANQVALHLHSNANVGIGTTSPSNRFNVVGSSALQTAVTKITRTHASASNNTYTFEVDSSSHTSNMTSGGAMAVDVNAGRAFTINGNGNVGIGTTSPTSKLEVSSNGAHGINISQDTTSSTLSGRLFLSNGTTNQACTLFNSGGTLRFATGGHIGNSSGGTKMTLLADGRLGVGTTSPLGTVHIFTADAGAAIATNTSHDDLIIENGGNCGIQLSGPASSYQYLAFGDTASANQGYVRYYHTDNRMDLRAGGTDTLSLVGGNVGIGTTSTNAKLDIRGGVFISGNHTDTGGQLNVWCDSNGYGNLAVYNFCIKTGANNSRTIPFFISHIGSVGIGTTSINSGIGLQVTTGGIYASNGDGYFDTINAGYFASTRSLNLKSGATGKVILTTGSNDQLKADSGGFVELSHAGSTSGGKFLTRRYSGDDYLSVFSTEYSSGSLVLGYGVAGKSGAAGFVSTYDNFSGHKTLLKINHNGINVLTTGSAATDTVGADLSMAERFRVQVDKSYFNNGPVGIGTTSPSTPLHIDHAGDKAITIESDGDSDSNFIFMKTSASTAQVYMGHETGTAGANFSGTLAGFAVFGNVSSGMGTQFLTGGGNQHVKMTIRHSGQVGIGVTNPNSYYFSNLVVGETTSGDKGITIRSSNAAKGVLAFADSDSGSARYAGYIAYNHSTNDMEFYTLAGNFAMMIDDAQQVGIGTTSPNYLLDVEKAGANMRVYNTTNNGNTDIHLRTAGTTGNSRIFFGDTAVSDVGSIIYRHNGNSLAFETNGSERMRIIGGSDGYVGIGTTSPQQELDVDGVIKQKVYTVSNLPSASSSTIGARAFVSDSYYPFSSSYLGSQISGGGSSFSPVYSDGSYWYMG